MFYILDEEITNNAKADKPSTLNAHVWKSFRYGSSLIIELNVIIFIKDINNKGNNTKYGTEYS